jgi:hypothetical protein
MTFPRTTAPGVDEGRGFVATFLGEVLESLPDLAQLCERTLLAKLVVVMHAHCVTSMAGLIQVILKMGLQSENIFFIQKPYSTIPSAAAKLRRLGIDIDIKSIRFPPGEYDLAVGAFINEGIARTLERCSDVDAHTLVLVDDGGILSEKVANEIGRLRRLRAISIQQTASGLMREAVKETSFPKIDVSRSAAKRHFESRIISQGICRKLEGSKIIKKKLTMGVAGTGALGSALSRLLCGKGYSIVCYDDDKNQRHGDFVQRDSINSLLDSADLILGCTGKNSLDNFDFNRQFRAGYFVSCSSRDIEFKKLLMDSGRGEIGVGDTVVKTRPKGGKLRVFNGGFPINFDRKKEWESPKEISITRALILGAILQALSLIGNTSSVRTNVIVKLDVHLQMAITRMWLAANGLSPGHFGVTESDFNSLAWWERESGGDNIRG